MECELPCINSNSEEMKQYFIEAKTIAVLGASPDTTKASNHVARYLKEVGYKMIPVYPKGDTILGEKVYRSLAEINVPVDMVVVFRKTAALDAIADSVIARGDVKTYWTQLELINNDAAQRVRDAGINVVQNYCAMIEHKHLLG